MIPLVTPEVVPTQDKALITLEKILEEAEVVIPTTVAVVLEEEKVLIVFALMLVVVAGEALLMPVTAPPVPVDDNPVMLLLAMVSVAMVPLLPADRPVMLPCPVIFVMVLLEIVEVPPKLLAKAVIEDVPPVQLLKVLPVICLGGVEPVPSVLLQPAIVVAPVTVMLEKLLLLF